MAATATVSAETWLAGSRDGYCALTENGPFSCDKGRRGAFGLLASEAQDDASAASACLRKCALCANCRYITVNRGFRDCSWYSRCPPAGSMLGKSSGFRSGATRPNLPGLHDRGALAATCSAQRSKRRASIALLFRGEAFRWGCDEWGVQTQREVSASYHKALIAPLERDHDACVSVFLFLSETHSCRDVHGQVQLRDVFSPWLSAATSERVLDQSQGLRRALSWFVETAGEPSQPAFSHVFIARHDVELLLPLRQWSWARERICLSSLSKGRLFNASHPHSVEDVLYAVPMALLSTFRSAIGSRVGLPSRWSDGSCVNGCFVSPPCPRKTVNGHACGLVLAHLVGTSRIGYLWPPPEGHTFSRPSQNQLKQPFYDRWPTS